MCPRCAELCSLRLSSHEDERWGVPRHDFLHPHLLNQQVSAALPNLAIRTEIYHFGGNDTAGFQRYFKLLEFYTRVRAEIFLQTVPCTFSHLCLCLVVCGVSVSASSKMQSGFAPFNSHSLCWVGRWTILHYHACVHSISYVQTSLTS